MVPLSVDSDIPVVAYRISIEGLVQGVGFRPFVYRLAREYGLSGWVTNRTNGVTLKVEGPEQAIPGFIRDLQDRAPVVSEIDRVWVEPDTPENSSGFQILASQDLTDETSEISPDIAVCAECLKDMKTQPQRMNYPFINCTNCGPRFSIIRDFPYDREKTTMAPFHMCDSCRKEYEETSDRRFHAQPVACIKCGPKYALHHHRSIVTDPGKILAHAVRVITGGGLLAVKGMGGYHLMCDALNEEAVSRLRALKHREGKPFAVMFRDMEVLRTYARLSEAEENSLLSWRRPIVLLVSDRELSHGISLGLNTLGAFLPYMPWHYLFFEESGLQALVMTSGNLAGEPILISDREALAVFHDNTDGVLTYNRKIQNRTDDSVVRVIGGKERIMRRSRGYVPSPIRMSFDVHGILATGAELSNCLCLGKGNRAYMSQHIGDLQNHETYIFFEETLARFRKLFRIEPVQVCCDLHPDYLSTRFARALNLPFTAVQHHHAHIAACMAENGIDEPVIGLAFDGTGYGEDGNIWGSEFMLATYSGYTRLGHFEYMPMPGGDKASEEPWRMGLALLYQAYGENLWELGLPFIRYPDPQKAKSVIGAIAKKINCPLTSGAGRLFDAVAAITGICLSARYHAEAPMLLESRLIEGISERYDFTLGTDISFLPAIRQIAHDTLLKTNLSLIATRFHNTVTDASYEMVRKISQECGIQKIVLTGGSFQNKYLFETLERKLVKNNFAVFTHRKVPCNDGGIALGQLVVAAKRK